MKKGLSIFLQNILGKGIHESTRQLHSTVGMHHTRTLAMTNQSDSVILRRQRKLRRLHHFYCHDVYREKAAETRHYCYKETKQ